MWVPSPAFPTIPILSSLDCDQMRDFLSQKSANIIKESSQDPSSANSMGIFEVTIDPEHYRAIQEHLNLITNGNGLLEILHQSSLATTPSQPPKVPKDGEEENAVLEEEVQSSTKPSSSSVVPREKTLKKREKISMLPELDLREGDDDEVIAMIASKSKGKVRSLSQYETTVAYIL